MCILCASHTRLGASNGLKKISLNFQCDDADNDDDFLNQNEGIETLCHRRQT